MSDAAADTNRSADEKITFKVVLISIAACLLYGVIGGFRSDISEIIGIMGTAGAAFSYVDVQLANTVCRFVTAFASPVIAFLVLKRSNFFILTAGFVTTILGLVCIAAASSLPVLILGLGILFALGTAALSFGIIFGIVSPLIGEKAAVVVSTIFTISTTFFGVIFAPVIQLLSDAFGYQGMLVIFILVIVCIYPLIFVISGKKKEAVTAVQKKEIRFKDALSLIFKDKAIYLLMAIFFVSGFCSGINNHFYTGMLTLDVPSLGVSLTYSLVKIIGALGAFAASFFILKIKKTMRAAGMVFLIYGITLLIISFTPDDSLMFIPFTLFAALVFCAVSPLSTLIVRRSYAPVLIGSVFCFLSLFQKIGSGLDSILGSIFFEMYGNFGVLLVLEFAAAVSLTAGLFCVSIVLKKRQKTAEVK